MISDYIQEEWYIYIDLYTSVITLSAMWNFWQDVNKYLVTKIDHNNNWKLFCHTKPPGIWRLEYIILNDKKVCLVWKAFLPDFI